MAGRYVLFDFDGVISDSVALAYDVARIVHPHLSRDEWLVFFEGNIFSSYDFSKCTDACKQKDEDYYALYTPRIGELSIFEGMERVIKELAATYALAIVSSSISTDVMSILEKHGLAKYFSDVFGKDVHTSKIEKIKMIFDRYGATSDECLFVTDTLGDILEVGEISVRSIGCSWGFHARERLMRGKPFRIVDAPGQLPSAIREYFSGTAKPIHESAVIP